jgi:PKD repeat protein
MEVSTSVHRVTILLLAALMVLPVSAGGEPSGEEGDLITFYEYHFSSPIVALGTEERVFTLAGMPMDAVAGAPSLPVEHLLLALRPGYTLKEVKVSCSPPSFLEIVEEYPRNPAESPAGNGPGVAEIVDRGAWDLAGTYVLEGVEVVCINLRPLVWDRYTGVLGLVSDYEVTVVGQEKGIEWLGDLGRVKDLVDNPAEVPDMPRIVPTSYLPSGSYEHLIITDEALLEPFLSLAEWKRERKALGSSAQNITSTVVTLQYILSRSEFWDVPASHAGTGNDTQSIVRNFIRAAYQEWGVDYVLLGGDEELIPSRKVWVSCYGYDDQLPADIYFTGLDGDWDLDMDGIYGESYESGSLGEEADLLSEAYVGRATVSNPQEAWNFVNKTIAYEGGSAEEYGTDLLFVGNMLDDEPTWGGDYKDEVYDEVLADEGLDLTTLYEREGTFSAAAFISALNSGPHLVNHMGHGSYSSFAGMDISDAGELVNGDPFVLYTQACMVAGFDQDDCIAEEFMKGENGAVAFIGNSRYGWYSSGSTAGSSHNYDLSFFSQVFNDNVIQLGRALSLSKEEWTGSAYSDSSMRWVYMELNLLGDPETSILMGGSINHPPVCGFTYHPDLPGVGEEVHFQDRSSDVDGEIVSWLWEFGDGGTSDMASPTHTYGQKGDYLVTLTVRDEDGDSSSMNASVPVGNELPHPDFSWSPFSIYSMDPVTFTDTSRDVDGSITDSNWSFGDGSVGTGGIVVHRYSRPGTYLVTLTVVDDDGASNTTSLSLEVLNSPPVASFECLGTVLSLIEMSFNDTSHDREGSLFSWHWDFGDGNGSAASSPSHAYAFPGDYNVVLTVMDRNGARSSASKTVVVLNRPPEASFTVQEGPHWSLDNISFQANGSDLDGKVSSFIWDFGDGATGDGEEVAHAYSFPGNYTVTLTCIDELGESTKLNATLNVLNLLPTSSMVVTRGMEHPLEIALTAEALDRDGNITIYIWSFGDGGTGEGRNVVHRYVTQGDYWVNLTVSDDRGGRNLTSLLVSVRSGDIALEMTNCTEGDDGWVLEASLSNGGPLEAEVLLEIIAGELGYQRTLAVPAGGSTSCQVPLEGFEGGNVSVRAIAEEGWDSELGNNLWTGTVTSSEHGPPWPFVVAILVAALVIVAFMVLARRR